MKKRPNPLDVEFYNLSDYMSSWSIFISHFRFFRKTKGHSQDFTVKSYLMIFIINSHIIFGTFFMVVEPSEHDDAS